MSRARELERQVNVKFDQRLYTEVEKISERLDLTVSQIVRRAIREGLKTLKTAKLPGSTTE
jgi:metal-responsive CopG/Arc/MetJ family transcriptional regulator